MKKLLLILMIVLAFSVNVGAQVNNGIPQKNVEHLKFQGIPTPVRDKKL